MDKNVFDDKSFSVFVFKLNKRLDGDCECVLGCLERNLLTEPVCVADD
jgi:hypothetical protein